MTCTFLFTSGVHVKVNNNAVELEKALTPDFFIPLNSWPPKSPDLNPVDYKIWDIPQARVYKTNIKNVGELRQHIDDKRDQPDYRV